jgi:hypothetical protein
MVMTSVQGCNLGPALEIVRLHLPRPARIALLSLRWLSLWLLGHRLGPRLQVRWRSLWHRVKLPLRRVPRWLWLVVPIPPIGPTVARRRRWSSLLVPTVRRVRITVPPHFRQCLIRRPCHAAAAAVAAVTGGVARGSCTDWTWLGGDEVRHGDVPPVQMLCQRLVNLADLAMLVPCVVVQNVLDHGERDRRQDPLVVELLLLHDGASAELDGRQSTRHRLSQDGYGFQSKLWCTCIASQRQTCGEAYSQVILVISCTNTHTHNHPPTHTPTPTYTYPHTHTPTYTHPPTHTHTSKCTHILTHTHTHACTHADEHPSPAHNITNRCFWGVERFCAEPTDIDTRLAHLRHPCPLNLCLTRRLKVNKYLIQCTYPNIYWFDGVLPFFFCIIYP